DEAGVEAVSPYRILVLLDTHHLWREFKRTKDATMKFIREEKAPEESVAVMSTHDAPAELQHFSSDPAALLAALNRIKPRPFISINTLGVEMTEYDAFEIDRGNRAVLSDYVQRFAIKNGIRLTGTGESSSLEPGPGLPGSEADRDLAGTPAPSEATGEGGSASLRPVRFVQGGGGGGSGGGGGGGSGGTTGGVGGGRNPPGGGNPNDSGFGGRPGSGSDSTGREMGMMSMPRTSVEMQVKQAAQEMVSEASLNTLRSLESMREIIRRMGRLDGRKVVMLLSEGYYIGFGSRTGFPISNHVQALIDLAARNNVTFYPIDARGLVSTGLTAEMSGNFARTSPRMSEALSRESTSFTESQNGLHALASGTGGLTYFNRNDLLGGFRKAVDDNTYYYIIGYAPARPPDGKYRKITVKLNRDGYTVRSRDGYFALAPGQEIQLAKVSTATVSEKDFKAAMKEATEAAKAMQAGQLDEALKRFERSIQIAPVSDRVFYYVGRIYLEKGDGPKAVEALRRSIELAPSKPDSNLALARFYLGEQKLDEAEKVLGAFVLASPLHAEAQYIRGIALEQLGRVSEAYASIQQALAAKPDGVEMYMSAGRLAMRVGKEDEGVAHLRKYVEMKGQNAENVKKYLEQNGVKL
ncbi:MAG: VWA domain-containing protein, partial [Acidobacteria bacterium]|nr:VWA domain-containing protein [Acidobacteriota bacterium]